MLGAYFGSTKIIQGAAGLGQGPLTAYADGVVGGSVQNPEMPGPLTSYHDGSLGAADGMLSAFADGVVGGAPPEFQMPGKLAAYHDGSLGWYDQAAHGLGQDENDTSAWNNGVLGPHQDDMTAVGPLQSFHDGSLGGYNMYDPVDVNLASAIHDLQRYPAARYPAQNQTAVQNVVGRSWQWGAHPDPHYVAAHGIGAYATAMGADPAPTLDLGDAHTMQELKTAMALTAPGQTATPDAQKVYTPDWYTNGIWDPQATLLWEYIVSAIPAFKGKTVSIDIGAQSYPNATGIGFLVAALSAPQSGTYGPDYMKANLPILYSWFTAGGGNVLPPFLSLADKTTGTRSDGGTSIKMSTLALYGLGAVAALGLVLVLRKRK